MTHPSLIKSTVLFACIFLSAPFPKSTAAEALLPESCTTLEGTQRALSLMQYYMNRQRLSAQLTLNAISSGTDSPAIERKVAKLEHKLELLTKSAHRKLDRLPTEIYYCTDPSCYNVSMQDKINAFRLATARIHDLHIAAADLGAAAIGLSAADTGEEALRNFNILMDATDSYPLMTMFCS